MSHRLITLSALRFCRHHFSHDPRNLADIHSHSIDLTPSTLTLDDNDVIHQYYWE